MRCATGATTSGATLEAELLAKIAFPKSAEFWMNSAAFPHTNGSHSGMPNTLGDAYAQAPVWMAKPSASGPKTKPTA